MEELSVQLVAVQAVAVVEVVKLQIMVVLEQQTQVAAEVVMFLLVVLQVLAVQVS